MPHKPESTEQSLDHVMKDSGENVNDSVAFVVAISVVELLKMIQVGIADGEFLVRLEASSNLALDLGRAWKPSGRVNRYIAFGSHQHGVQAGALLCGRENSGDHLISTGGEPGLHLVGIVAARQGGHWNNRRKRVALEPPDQTQP